MQKHAGEQGQGDAGNAALEPILRAVHGAVRSCSPASEQSAVRHVHAPVGNRVKFVDPVQRAQQRACSHTSTVVARRLGVACATARLLMRPRAQLQVLLVYPRRKSPYVLLGLSEIGLICKGK